MEHPGECNNLPHKYLPLFLCQDFTDEWAARLSLQAKDILQSPEKCEQMAVVIVIETEGVLCAWRVGNFFHPRCHHEHLFGSFLEPKERFDAHHHRFAWLVPHIEAVIDDDQLRRVNLKSFDQSRQRLLFRAVQARTIDDSVAEILASWVDACDKLPCIGFNSVCVHSELNAHLLDVGKESFQSRPRLHPKDVGLMGPAR
mmetsp:Transcript_8481/g.26944  ORF Transcript_8481/g.26944 Transcript_8481/m.26944 type:complete len:200 (-) Transcript_8481:314-913(-)